VLSSTLVRPCTAFYVISVRRFGSLPVRTPLSKITSTGEIEQRFRLN